MSCTGCASKFGFLKSEHGCPGCGFAYCGKCLSEKIVLNDGSKPVNVCKNCSTSRNVDRRRSQPAPIQSHEGGRAYFQVEPGELPPPSMRQAAKRGASIGGDNMSVEERALRERMEKLKEELKGPSVSQTELEIRLAKLKGKSFDEHVAEKAKPFYFGPDNRTPAQRANDLMAQMREEMELERKLKRPEQEIAERLAKLKGEQILETDEPKEGGESIPMIGGERPECENEPAVVEDKELAEVERLMKETQKESEKEAKAAVMGLEQDKALQDELKRISVERKKKQDQPKTDSKKDGDKHESGDEDDSAEAEKLAKMILEEEEITARLSRLAPPPSSFGDVSPTCPSPRCDNELEDELPWCCICTQDARVRCIGCDGDLYCQRCFKEGHQQFDISDHPTVPYENKGKKLEHEYL